MQTPVLYKGALENELKMANRFDWNALDQKISHVQIHCDESDRTKALGILAVSAILEVPLDEAADSITDGPMDRGVDAVFIDDRDSRNDIHLFQVKCVGEFSKSGNNFPSSEIDKISSFLNDLLSHDISALRDVNPALRSKVQDSIDILSEANAKIIVHFVGNMAPLVEAEHGRILASFARYVAVEFRMHDLEALSDFFLEQRTPEITREIQVIDTNFFDRVDQNVRGFVCTVSALDIANMIRSERDPNQVEPGIFDRNVRIYLKRKNRVNAKILESVLAEDNHLFWYMNNGITLTCDRIEVAPSKRAPKLRLRNVQIVNGGQTSNCLFEASRENREALERAILLLRIIETSSEDVKATVAESTNSQTPINARDLRSNDRQQRQLEDAFAAMNFYYERKAEQFSDKPFQQRVDAHSAAQAYLAYGVGLPEVAKKDRGRIFGDLYETVFSEGLLANHLLVSYQLMQKLGEEKSSVRKRIRSGEDVLSREAAIIDGSLHMLFCIRQICVRDGLDMWDFGQVSLKIREAIEIVSDVFAEEQLRNTTFSSNRFFKESKTKDQITLRVG